MSHRLHHRHRGSKKRVRLCDLVAIGGRLRAFWILPQPCKDKVGDMHQMQYEQQRWVEDVLPAERARLVRLCAYLTGDPGAAEDIAQEAMIEAWCTADRISEQAASSAWLAGCARNSCRRWARRRGRTLARELPLD